MGKKRVRGNGDGTWYEEPNGKYRAQVVLPDGKRKSKTFRTKAECKQWISKMKAEATQPQLGTPETSAPVKTVGMWMVEWLQTMLHHLRPGTYRDYARYVRDFILPEFETVPLKDLSRKQVNALYKKLLKRKIKVPTVRYVHRVLHCALEFAVAEDEIMANPAHKAKLPKMEEREMQILNEQQIWIFLAAVRGMVHEALYHLAVKTGMREGELLGLKWQDIDFLHGTVTIQRQVKRIPNQGLLLQPLKTKCSRRTISLGETVLSLLRELKIGQEAKRLEMIDAAVKGGYTFKWEDNDLIFPTDRGTPFDQSNLVAEFKAVLELAGLPEIRFHDLRHTAASVMLKYAKDVLTVSRTLGHSRASTTLNIYAHLLPGMQAEAAQMVDTALTPLPVGDFLKSEIGVATEAENKKGMSLAWVRKKPATRKKVSEIKK